MEKKKKSHLIMACIENGWPGAHYNSLNVRRKPSAMSTSNERPEPSKDNASLVAGARTSRGTKLKVACPS